MAAFQWVFVGPDSKLRAIWRAVIFYALGIFLFFLVLERPFAFIAKSVHLSPGLTAGNVALSEIEGLHYIHSRFE